MFADALKPRKNKIATFLKREHVKSEKLSLAIFACPKSYLVISLLLKDWCRISKGIMIILEAYTVL